MGEAPKHPSSRHLVGNHHLDDPDDRQDEQDGEDDATDNIRCRRSPLKIADPITGTLNTKCGSNNAAHNAQKTRLVGIAHGLLVPLALGFKDLVADSKTNHHDDRKE